MKKKYNNTTKTKKIKKMNNNIQKPLKYKTE